MTKRHSKLFNIILCAILCLLSLVNTAAPALAQEPNNNLGTLKVTAIADNKPLADKTCKLYYVANMEGVLDDTFADYKIKITDGNLEESTALANLLESIILRDNIKPDYTAKTDAAGTAQFDGLAPGIYILLSDDVINAEITYLAQPSLFVIGYNQTMELEIKHTVKYPEPPPEEPDKPKTIQKVIKKWDDGSDPNRPESIKVQLLRNGKVQETIQLSAKNNWRYTWTNLDKYAKWSVVEIEIPDGYEMEVEKDGLTTIITNSKTPEIPPTPPEKPEKPTPPTPEKPDEPETPEKPKIPEIPTKPNTPKLPQTGTTWYYVPILAAIGLAALCVGLILHKDDKAKLKDRTIKAAGLILILLGAGLIFLAGIVAGYNQKDETFAENQSNAILRETEKNIQSNKLVYADFDITPDYLLDDTRDMPVVEINNLDVIGQITIPDLGIDLPVCDAWDTVSAKSAPCRYTGSAYANDLVIAGHSYKSHFRQLYNAKPDMLVQLTDMDGNLFEYVITETQTINEYDVEALESGTWDLTLFTCTSDSRHRVLVRCQLLETA